MRIFVKLEKDNKRLFEYHPGEMGKLENKSHAICHALACAV